MNLSNDLLLQFAKITIDDKKVDQDNLLYGTIVENGDRMYVKLDGSEVLTPIASYPKISNTNLNTENEENESDSKMIDSKVSGTTEIKDGERVSVLLKNHTATITGNITSPSISIDTVISSFDIVNSFIAIANSRIAVNESDIEISKSDILTQGSKISVLESQMITANSNIAINKSNIDLANSDIRSLDSKITAANSNIAINKTNIDLANSAITSLDARVVVTESDIGIAKSKIAVNESQLGIYNSVFTIKDGVVEGIKGINGLDWIKSETIDAERLYAETGLIRNAVMKDGKITGELIAVTVRGDLIEANTLKADRLVIKGTDGIYYKLNTDGVKIEAEQTNENSLNGSIIIAKSITASKISVSDLVAFDATIGGFIIGANSLYSVGKSSVDSGATGIYLGKDGQMNVGDATDYIKYHKNADGTYSLDVSAKNITFGTTKQNVATAISDAAKTATNYMNLDSNGLVVGDMTASTLGNNILIDSDSIDIRNGDTVYASYGANHIYLGQNDSSTIIDICNGSANMFSLYDGTFGKRFIIQTDEEINIYGDKRLRAWSSVDTEGGYSAGLYASTVDDSSQVNSIAEVYMQNGSNYAALKMDRDNISLCHQTTSIGTELYLTNTTIVLNADTINCNAKLYNNYVPVSTTDHTHDKLICDTNDDLRYFYSDFYRGFYFRHNTDISSYNVFLGSDSYRWTEIFSVNALNTSSDIRLKENISKDMDKYLEMLDLLDPISYNWISEADNPNRKTHISYGAQYVWKAMKDVGLEEKDFAGFCRTHNDTSDGPVYNYSLCLEEFIPILHAKIKQLETRILELEKEK